MSNVYVVEAYTAGAGSGVLPALAALSPPNPPTLAYFQGQNAKFTAISILPLTPGPMAILADSALTDVLLVYADAAAVIQTGQVPAALQNLSAVGGNLANGVYLNQSAFRAP